MMLSLKTLLFTGIIFFGLISVADSPVCKKKESVISDDFRLKFGYRPHEVGMDSMLTKKIESFVNRQIKEGVFPGCRLLVARRSKVFLNESYGFFTYQKKEKVGPGSLYDLASLTKVLSTAPVVIKLTQSGRLDLDRPISDYLTELRGTNKEKMTARQLLTHTSGTDPAMPGWFETFDKAPEFRKYYRKTASDTFNLQVADSLYAPFYLPDSLKAWVIRSPLLPKKAGGKHKYRYSDAGFYLLRQLCERIAGEPISDFGKREIYREMEINKLTFKPLAEFEKTQIVPSGYDKYFRKTFVRGYPQDYAACMDRGIGGHAGLFGTAESVGAVLQLFLQNGKYGDRQVLDSAVVQAFLKRSAAGSKRALAWEKQLPGRKKPIGTISSLASVETFGHTGFTGSAIWADPENDLVFVFLSNRTCPDLHNKKLIYRHIRRKIHDMIYRAMEK